MNKRKPFEPDRAYRAIGQMFADSYQDTVLVANLVKVILFMQEDDLDNAHLVAWWLFDSHFGHSGPQEVVDLLDSFPYRS